MPGSPKKRERRRKARAHKQLMQGLGGDYAPSQLVSEQERKLANYAHYGLIDEIFDEQGRVIKDCLRNMHDDRREELAQLGRDDLHFLCVVPLGYTRLTTPDALHGEMCRRAITPACWRLWLLPRGTFKTSIFNRAKNIQRVIRDPLSTHIIVTSDGDFLKIMSDALAAIVTDNRLFQFLYPEIKPQEGKWSTKNRTIERPGREDITEPTWEFRTVKQPVAGRHVDSMTIDDAVNEANTTTPKVHAHVIRFLQGLYPTLDTEDLMITGTPYIDWDGYGWIQDQPELLDLFDPWIERLYTEEKGERTYLFPHEWDDRRVVAAKAIMGLSLFSSQYMSDPLPEELQRFHKQMFKYYKADKLPDVGIYIIVDPASGKGTSEPAIVVVGVDGEGNVYVIDYETGFKSASACNNGIFAMYKRHGAQQVCIEAMGAGGKITYQNVQDEMQKRGIAMPLVTLPITQQDKDARIMQMLEPPYTAGVVYHADWLEESPLEEQLLRFPKGRAKDIIDALSYGVHRARRYGYSGVPVAPEESDIVQRLKSAKSVAELSQEEYFAIPRCRVTVANGKDTGGIPVI